MKREDDNKRTRREGHRVQLRPSKRVLLFALCAILALFLEPVRLPLEFFRAKALHAAKAGYHQSDQSQVLMGGGYSPQTPVSPPPIQKGVPGYRRGTIDATHPNHKKSQDTESENGESIELDEEVRIPPRRRKRSSVFRFLPAKMVPPRIPYLSELAVEIDEHVREQARSEPRSAETNYIKAIARARKNEDRSKESELLTNLGHLYYLTGQFNKAVDTLESALSLTRVLGTVQEEAALLRDTAAALTGWGEYERAANLNVLALRLATGSNDRQTAQMIRNNMGVIEKNRGEYEAARKRFGEALKKHAVDGTVKILILRNLGDLCRQWGEFDCAQESYKRMLESAQALQDPKQAAEAHLRLAGILGDRNRHLESLEHILESLTLLEIAGEPVDIASKLMGDVYLDRGMTEKAEPYLKKAGYASSLGRMKLLQSQPRQAEKHYRKLRSAAEQAGNPDALFTAYTGLGMAAEALGDYEKSTTHYTMAVTVLEEIRSGLLPSERRNFFAVRVNGFLRSTPAKRLVKIAVKRGKPEESIYPSELTRQRSFADNLSSRGEGAYFRVPRSILDEESRLTAKLASLKTALRILPKHAHAERYRDLTKQIREADSVFKSWVSRLYQDHKDYATVKYPRPVALNEADLKPDEYVLLIDQLKDGLALRLLKGKRIVGASFIQWDVKEQVKAVNEFRKPFEKCRLRSFDCDLAGRLHQKLLSDMLKGVPEGSRIIIIPDGVWALIPFEALVAKGKPTWRKAKWGAYPDGVTYVGDLWEISYYQSLTAMTLVRKLKAHAETGRRLLVMADPVFSFNDARAKSNRFLAQKPATGRVMLMKGTDPPHKSGFVALKRLNETGVLAKNLKELYGKSCDAFTGFECNKRTFVDQIAPTLNRYEYLVFATHGFASNSVPGVMEPVLWLSTIPRASGGFLTMSEVAGLTIDADLAALTACQTGLGQMLAGEGVMSMGRAFQCAGAKSVFMSLWGVYEPSSVTLTEEFFRNLRKGKGKLAALRAARERIKNEGYKHPFYWSAFILVGETD